MKIYIFKNKLLIISVLIIGALNLSLAQEVIHPRGLIRADELGQIKARLSKEPLKTYLNNLKLQVSQRMKQVSPDSSGTDRVYLSSQMATLYLLTEDKKWAVHAWDYLDAMISTDIIFNDPLSRGLTRAALLMNASITYDFCYAAWNKNQREKVNEAIYRNLASVNSNMGRMANYNIASNWMGVRYGAVIFASQIWDMPEAEKAKKSPIHPFLWDASKRLQDHLQAVIYENGWNGESMGYHAYDWTFIGPALIALYNGSQNKYFKVENFASKLLNTLWALSTASVDIPTFNRRGMKPDLSDDNLNAFGPSLIGMGFRLYPENQQSYLKWIFDYRFPPPHTFDDRHGLIHALLYYPLEMEAYNPKEIGWLNYHDPEQGIVMFRNQFKDSSDIVMTLSATSRRVRGHQGPDTHTWRLFGLGVPWVIGGGRTGVTYLQPNLFPDSSLTPRKKMKQTGVLHHYRFFPQGGEALSSGSCLNVINHKRWLQVDYKLRSNCEAVFLFQEKADNGKRWRIQTPEFNQYKELENGYLLTAPNGSSMRVIILKNNAPQNLIRTGLHRYGGETVRLNPGILYNQNKYAQSRWIDIHCEGELTVLITLQKPNVSHPKITQVSESSWKVSDQMYYLKNFDQK